MSSIEDRVKKVVAERLNVSESNIEHDSHFTNDLGADSLDLVEVVMAFEEEFDIEIPDEESELIATVGDAVKKIEEYQA